VVTKQLVITKQLKLYFNNSGLYAATHGQNITELQYSITYQVCKDIVAHDLQFIPMNARSKSSKLLLDRINGL
jgi:hypothetical protein